MAATPVGDLFDKYCFAKSSVKVYAFVQGQIGLQNIRTINAGGYVGIFDSWIVRDNQLYLTFYATAQDQANFRNPLYINYFDVKKLSFDNVPTWTGDGINFSAFSTSVQAMIDNWNLTLGTGTGLATLFDKVKKYAPIILIGYLAITLLPSIIQSIKSVNEKK